MAAPQQSKVVSISKPPIKGAAPSAGSTATPPAARDSYAVTAIADITDRSLHAATARYTAGISPAALAQAYLDWLTHLAYSPGKRLQLVDKAMRKAVRFANYAGRCAMQQGEGECCIEPLPHDKRFVGAGWQKWPYNFVHQAFLLQQQWWHNATTGVRGLSKQHEEMVEFGATPNPRHDLAVEFPADKSGGPSAHASKRRDESGERIPKPDGGLGARRQRQEAGWHREVCRRP